MHELVLSDVNKIYPGGFHAVHDFNIEVNHGEFIVLVGPSGCGKSTVLRMIAGLEEISRGDMILAGKRINKVAPSDRNVSMVFQNYALYGHMSVYKNIGFSQIIRGENSNTLHGKVMDAADIVQLTPELNRFPKNLSGGQRQRVALARSVVSQANVILMDEPLSNLDAKLRVESRRELAKLHQQLGNTFVYVTHDQTEAMTMATRIVVMNKGRVQQIGTPQEVHHLPENMFVGGFIGTPPMSFIRGQVDGNQFMVDGVDVQIAPNHHEIVAPYNGQTVVMGARPEHFALEPEHDTHVMFKGTVSDVEYLGNHSLVYLTMADNYIIASVAGMIPYDINDTGTFYLDMARVHFFDPESEKRIRVQEDEKGEES